MIGLNLNNESSMRRGRNWFGYIDEVRGYRNSVQDALMATRQHLVDLDAKLSCACPAGSVAPEFVCRICDAEIQLDVDAAIVASAHAAAAVAEAELAIADIEFAKDFIAEEISHHVDEETDEGCETLDTEELDEVTPAELSDDVASNCAEEELDEVEELDEEEADYDEEDAAEETSDCDEEADYDENDEEADYEENEEEADYDENEEADYEENEEDCDEEEADYDENDEDCDEEEADYDEDAEGDEEAGCEDENYDEDTADCEQTDGDEGEANGESELTQYEAENDEDERDDCCVNKKLDYLEGKVDALLEVLNKFSSKSHHCNLTVNMPRPLSCAAETQAPEEPITKQRRNAISQPAPLPSFLHSTKLPTAPSAFNNVVKKNLPKSPLPIDRRLYSIPADNSVERKSTPVSAYPEGTILVVANGGVVSYPPNKAPKELLLRTIRGVQSPWHQAASIRSNSVSSSESYFSSSASFPSDSSSSVDSVSSTNAVKGSASFCSRRMGPVPARGPIPVTIHRHFVNRGPTHVHMTFMPC